MAERERAALRAGLVAGSLLFLAVVAAVVLNDSRQNGGVVPLGLLQVVGMGGGGAAAAGGGSRSSSSSAASEALYENIQNELSRAEAKLSNDEAAYHGSTSSSGEGSGSLNTAMLSGRGHRTWGLADPSSGSSHHEHHAAAAAAAKAVTGGRDAMSSQMIDNQCTCMHLVKNSTQKSQMLGTTTQKRCACTTVRQPLHFLQPLYPLLPSLFLSLLPSTPSLESLIPSRGTHLGSAPR